MHGGLVMLENATPRFWRRAPAALAVPLVWLAVFLAWVPFRAADLGAMVECYRALGHGGWRPLRSASSSAQRSCSWRTSSACR